MTHIALRRHRRTAVIAALLLAGAVPFGLVACSAGSDASTAKDATAGVGAEWGSCMWDAGFNVQDPTHAQVESGVMPAPADRDQEEFGPTGSSCAQRAGVQGITSAPETTTQNVD